MNRTLHAFRAAGGRVYYLQRVDGRDGYEIRHSPGRKPVLVRRIDSKAEWYDFVGGLA